MGEHSLQHFTFFARRSTYQQYFFCQATLRTNSWNSLCPLATCGFRHTTSLLLQHQEPGLYLTSSRSQEESANLDTSASSGHLPWSHCRGKSVHTSKQARCLYFPPKPHSTQLSSIAFSERATSRPYLPSRFGSNCRQHWIRTYQTRRYAQACAEFCCAVRRREEQS